MKLLLILCLLSLPARAQRQDLPEQAPPEPANETQPLPRSKGDQKKSGEKTKSAYNPTGKIEQSLEGRRARIAEARKKARDRARARLEDKKPEGPAFVIPFNSSSKKELSGDWVLKGESLEKALMGQFQKTVGKGATFKLRKIQGNYIVSMSSDLTRLAVVWEKWKMDSTSTRGESSVTLSVSVEGLQEYEILQITDGKSPKTRKFVINLLEDKTNSASFFQGTKMRTKVALPSLSSGHWSLQDGIFHLQGSDKETAWEFSPHPAE
jgi:hypothetical protein